MGSGGGTFDAADVVGAARLNQKTVFVGTDAQINALTTTYAGQVAFCTSTGSGFTVNNFYQRNAANSSWTLSGGAENSVNKNVSGGYLGCDSGATAVHYQELGRTTLNSTATSMTVSSFTARKYLRIIVTGLYSATNLNPALQFNSDTAGNYAWRRSDNGGADTTSTSDSKITIGFQSQQNQFIIIDLVNISAQEKIVTSHAVRQGTAGAANAPNRDEVVGKWANTSAQISTVKALDVDGNNFASGSELIILGHD